MEIKRNTKAMFLTFFLKPQINFRGHKKNTKFQRSRNKYKESLNFASYTTH